MGIFRLYSRSNIRRDKNFLCAVITVTLLILVYIQRWNKSDVLRSTTYEVLSPDMYREPQSLTVLIIVSDRYQNVSTVQEEVGEMCEYLRVRHEVRLSHWSFEDLETERLYDAVVVLNLISFSDMEQKGKITLKSYCKRHSLSLIVFHWKSQEGLASNQELMEFPQYPLKDVTSFRIDPKIRMWRITRDGGNVTHGLNVNEQHQWVAFDTRGKSRDIYAPLSYAVQGDKSSEDHVVGLIDTGFVDGVRKIVLGNTLSFWLHHSMFLDALHNASRGSISTPLKRTVIIDIDDMFLGKESKMTFSDVKALMELQKRMRSYIRNFKFNLAFSGKYYMAGTQEQIEGDIELTKVKDEFLWFPHTYRHTEAREIPKLHLLLEEMNANKELWEKIKLPLVPHYTVPPAHSGLYPIIEPLYTALRQVWDIRVTSAMLYNVKLIANQIELHKGFEHANIQVLPRESVQVYSKHTKWHLHPGGKPGLDTKIRGGRVYTTFLYNQLIIVMTHSYNFGADRIGNYAIEETFRFLKRWTNLDFITEQPLVAAKDYFDRHPEEKAIVWRNPCSLWLKKTYLNASRCEGYRALFPDFIILGPPRAGSYVLSTLLKLDPSMLSNRVQANGKDDLAFFNKEENYQLGVEWYMDQFPNRSVPHTLLFESSPTYFAAPEVPLRMFLLIRRALLFVLLEDPSLRAYSVYQVARRHNNPLALLNSFHDVITAPSNADVNLIKLRDQCLLPGLYMIHIKRWLRHYSIKQMMFIDSEQLYNTPVTVMKTVQEALKRNTEDQVDYSELIRIDPDTGELCSVNQNANLSKCTIRPERYNEELKASTDRLILHNFYRSSNLQLYQLLKQHERQIPSWLKTFAKSI